MFYIRFGFRDANNYFMKQSNSSTFERINKTNNGAEDREKKKREQFTQTHPYITSANRVQFPFVFVFICCYCKFHFATNQPPSLNLKYDKHNGHT